MLYLYRCYSTPNQRDFDLLKTSRLLNEDEQPLRSMKDYDTAIKNTIKLHPTLKEYLRLSVLPSLGDYLTFYYQKKLIAQVK